MSKISLEPNASGAGTFTLAAPNSNTNRTLNLPDASGTVATEENLPPGYTDSDALDLFNATGSAPVYACRAWVNFDGLTGSGNTIRGSGNVSSVTRNGSGNYTLNFTTALPDTNWSFVGTATQDDGTGPFNNFAAGQNFIECANNPTRVTTSVDFLLRVPGTGFEDAGNISIQIFR